MSERIGDYLVHPAAQLFPLLDESSDRFAELKAKIADHGQLVPIQLRDGVLLDGRNRLRVCLALGIPPRVEEYGGSLPPSELIGDLNLTRRDLSEEDRTRIRAELELMTQAERIAAAQKAAGERGKEHGKEGGRGHKKPPTTESREGVSEPKSRARHTRETVGRVAKAAGVSHYKARKAIKEAKAKQRRDGSAAKKATAPKQKRPAAEQGQKRLRIAGGSVQRTHALLSEFTACARPFSRADITARLGAKSPREARRQFEAFFDCVWHVPWAVVEIVDGGFRFTINAELKRVCEQQTPLPEVGGWTLQELASFFKNLRRTIAQKRAANKCERTRRQWNTDAVLKVELLNLVEFIERELDKVPFAEDRYRFSPVERRVEKRLTQPSAGGADPTEGGSNYVNEKITGGDGGVNAGPLPEL